MPAGIVAVVTKVKGAIKERIEKAQAAHASNFEKMVIIHQCLSIILDDRLARTALFDSSYVRRKVNRDFSADQDDSPPPDLQEQKDSLSDILTNAADVINNRDTRLERKIDAHLRELSVTWESKNRDVADILLLMEELYPSE